MCCILFSLDHIPDSEKLNLKNNNHGRVIKKKYPISKVFYGELRGMKLKTFYFHVKVKHKLSVFN